MFPFQCLMIFLLVVVVAAAAVEFLSMRPVVLFCVRIFAVINILVAGRTRICLTKLVVSNHMDAFDFTAILTITAEYFESL